MSRTDYGSVDVEIGDETYTLRPTLNAMDKIGKQWPGGIGEALNGVSGLGARELAFVIAAGAGIGARLAKDLPEQIFAAGTVHLAAPVIEYLTLLINPTGRDADEESEEDPEGE